MPHTLDPSGPYSANRLFEWVMAIAMVLMALTLALPGDSLDRGAIRQLSDAGMSEESMAFVLASIGMARCVALFANGNLPFYGPILRYIGSVVGATFWAYIMTVLAVDGFVVGKASIVMPLVGSLTIGEILSVKRAVKDGRFKTRR
ncbi:MAG TPA: hypothetical protein VIU82_21825 [Bosea sp. (in: a-proteobacteria)]